ACDTPLVAANLLLLIDIFGIMRSSFHASCNNRRNKQNHENPPTREPARGFSPPYRSSGCFNSRLGALPVIWSACRLLPSPNGQWSRDRDQPRGPTSPAGGRLIGHGREAGPRDAGRTP